MRKFVTEEEYLNFIEMTKGEDWCGPIATVPSTLCDFRPLPRWPERIGWWLSRKARPLYQQASATPRADNPTPSTLRHYKPQCVVDGYVPQLKTTDKYWVGLMPDGKHRNFGFLFLISEKEALRAYVRALRYAHFPIPDWLFAKYRHELNDAAFAAAQIEYIHVCQAAYERQPQSADIFDVMDVVSLDDKMGGSDYSYGQKFGVE